MYERAYMTGASRAGAVTRGMRLGGANFPNVVKIHPEHPTGVNGPLLPSVLDLGCGVISADLKNALLVASGVFFFSSTAAVVVATAAAMCQAVAGIPLGC